MIRMQTVVSGPKCEAEPVTSSGVCVFQERAFGGVATPVAQQAQACTISKHKPLMSIASAVA